MDNYKGGGVTGVIEVGLGGHTVHFAQMVDTSDVLEGALKLETLTQRRRSCMICC